MNALANLTRYLTLPYQRGAEFQAVPLGDDQAGATAIPKYDFTEYRARWGESPRIATYVIAPRGDIGGDDVALTLTCSLNGADHFVDLTVPQRTRAGTGFVIPFPPSTDATARLKSLAAAPPLTAAGKDGWDLVVLLGNVAKLAWLLGVEKDVIARVKEDVGATRFVATAFAAGLDALGKDLRVPRFPPRPYSWDGDTVGLWHLDEAPDGGPVTTVSDQGTRSGAPGHPGTVVGAVAGVPGKYGTGFAFSGGSAITVAASSDFDIAADSDATIEAFVTTAAVDATPRAIVVRRAVETAAGSNTAGWSLCVVNARGFDANVLFALCDGTTEARLFADLSIGDARFHHVAGVVDRKRKRARLFVDGVQRATAPIDALRAIAPHDDVRFGSTAAGNPFAGTIDEVRISRVARSTFHPALGEDDDAYRARLRIFRRWVLPTPANVIGMINEAAPFRTDPAPYILVETNQATQTAQCPIRIVPTALPAGTAIAVDGTSAQDDSVAGPPDDDGFDPSLDLISYTNPAVDALADPGQGRMQAGAAALLDALVAAAGSKLILEHSFDPSGPTPLHAVGRALRLRHSTKTTNELGALAHRVGFTYVRNLGPDLAVAVAKRERLAIRSNPPANARVDVGSAFDLTVDPSLPASGLFAWTIITPGPAAAHLVSHSADPATLKTPLASRPRVRLVTDAPGDLAVRVEYSFQGRTRSGALAFRIDPISLADGHAIDTIGNVDPPQAQIIGAPEAVFDPAYLVTHAANPAIDFGADANNAKMQVVTRDALDALVALLAARGVTGRLKVVASFVPGGPGVESVGRRLVLQHSTLDAGALGALAARLFDLIARSGTTITAFMRPDAWVAIGDAAGAPVPAAAALGAPLTLSAAPATLPSGTYNWSTRSIGAGAGSFDTVFHPTAQFTPTSPGLLMLVLTYVAREDTKAAPYTFEIRLKPALDVPATVIPKEQYDIIMNLLASFHPIGVEVRTESIRKHVREIEQDPTKAFPAYSFANFRV
jgi:hypothetical protein